ncbi:MAG: ribosome-associated translation inhibitor RaiA [Rhodospirillales bacterium]
MEISVKGKHVDVGDALRGHVEGNLKSNVKKYFDRAIGATVIFSREAHMFRADISVHAGRGMTMQGKSTGEDAYAAFDGAVARIGKQLRRYKRRIRDHHKGRNNEEILKAQQYIIAAGDGEEEAPEDLQPAIIAEMSHDIATLTVGEAVMRMDLADSLVVVFRNRAHNGINVIYRRPDGNIGWIDPSNSQGSTD